MNLLTKAIQLEVVKNSAIAAASTCHKGMHAQQRLLFSPVLVEFAALLYIAAPHVHACVPCIPWFLHHEIGTH